MKNNNILITGNLGVIGGIILPRLQTMGFNTFGYDLKDGNDILDTDRLAERLENMDACVHLAGIPGPWGRPWEEYLRTNVKGTQSVIKACKKAGVNRLVYMSSGAVYGFTHGKCQPKQLPIKESDPFPPDSDLDDYDKSKILCEKHLKEAVNSNLSAIALRMDTPLPHAPMVEHHLYVSISEDNLAEAIRAAIQAKFKGFGAFNIADKVIHNSINIDVQKWIKEKYPNVPNKTKDRESLLDISKAKRVLGYNPQ